VRSAASVKVGLAAVTPRSWHEGRPSEMVPSFAKPTFLRFSAVRPSMNAYRFNALQRVKFWQDAITSRSTCCSMQRPKIWKVLTKVLASPWLTNLRPPSQCSQVAQTAEALEKYAILPVLPSCQLRVDIC